MILLFFFFYIKKTRAHKTKRKTDCCPFNSLGSAVSGKRESLDIERRHLSWCSEMQRVEYSKHGFLALMGLFPFLKFSRYVLSVS